MIIGVGLDLERIDRFRDMLARWGDRFAQKLFTPGEIAYARARPRPEQHFAARFAAKEAALKALGVPKNVGLEWHHFEVQNDAGGAPRLVLTAAAAAAMARLGGTRVHLSISHSPDTAAAVVIIES